MVTIIGEDFRIPSLFWWEKAWSFSLTFVLDYCIPQGAPITYKGEGKRKL